MLSDAASKNVFTSNYQMQMQERAFSEIRPVKRRIIWWILTLYSWASCQRATLAPISRLWLTKLWWCLWEGAKQAKCLRWRRMGDGRRRTHQTLKANPWRSWIWIQSFWGVLMYAWTTLCRLFIESSRQFAKKILKITLSGRTNSVKMVDKIMQRY